MITTRAKRHGICFQRHELRPVGIIEDSCAWGVWVEGREIDVKSRQQEERRQFDSQAPHMVVAPIHPNLWPTAFTIEILVQHRPIAADTNPLSCDAIYGVSDALSRCGANLLFVETSQIGYDLFVYTATCDMASLRMLTQNQLSRADRAGLALAEARKRRQEKTLSDRDFKIAEHKSELERTDASRTLGMHLLPRLADLSAHLLVMEDYRKRYQKPEHLVRYRGWQESDDREMTQKQKLLALGHTRSLFKLVVGGESEPNRLPKDRKHAMFRQSIETSWFFNSKCSDAGENMYFLDYEKYWDFNRLRRLRDGQSVGGDTQADPPPANDPEKDDMLDMLYEQAHEIELARRPTGFMKALIDESACSQRAKRSKDCRQYESAAVSELVMRQAYVPVRITPLTALAHARFWHFVLEEDPLHGMVEFKYDNGMLSPKTDARGSMQRIYRFLNEMSGATATPALERRFGPEAAIFATIDQQDRFLRMRFEMEDRECDTFLSVKIEHSVNEDHKTHTHEGDSRGLLAETLAFFLAKGLRAEHANNITRDVRISDDLTEELRDEGSIYHQEVSSPVPVLEMGTLSLVLKAFVKNREELSKDIPGLTTDEKVWKKQYDADKFHFEEERSKRQQKSSPPGGPRFSSTAPSKPPLPAKEEAGLALIALIAGNPEIGDHLTNVWKLQFAARRQDEPDRGISPRAHGVFKTISLELGFAPHGR